MRILILCNIFPPGYIGGYELGASEIAKGLSARGHEVHVLTSDFLVDDAGGDAGGPGQPTIHRSLECAEPARSPREHGERAWLGAFLLPSNIRDLAGRLVSLRPDAILCFNLAGLGAPGLLRLFAASGMRPVLYLMDNVFATMCFDPLRRQAFERVFPMLDWPQATRFLFMSQTLRDEVETALGVAVPHAGIVPGWFDPAAVAPVENRQGGPVRFLFAARIAGHKGIDLVLDACAALVRQGCRDFVVDVFGAGEVAVMLQRIVAAGLSPFIRYQGSPPKAELMPRLRDYDALLFPSWHREPFGFAVAEAAVAGCIPVMSFGVGAAEWFLDGVDSIKIARDAAALHAAMQHVVTMTAAQRVRMRAAAQETALNFFRFADALDRVEASLVEASGVTTREPRVVEAALAVLTETWRERQHD